AGIQRAQFTREEIAPPTGTPLPPAAAPAAPAGGRVVIIGRGNRAYTPHYFTDQERNERIGVVNSGVHIRIDGLDQLGTVTMETDRLVTWLPNAAPGSP